MDKIAVQKNITRVGVIAEKRTLDTRLLIEALIFLMFLLPAKIQSVKAVILITLALFVAINICVAPEKFVINKVVLFWLLIYFTTQAYFLFKGTINNLPILKTYIPSILVYPILFAIVFVINPDFKRVNFTKVMIWTGLAIGVYIVVYVLLFKAGIIKAGTSILFGTVVNMNGGFLNYFSQNMTSLFVIPSFVVTRLMLNKQFPMKRRWKGLGYISVLMMGLAILMTGRRALMLLLVISPFFAYFVINWRDRRKMVWFFGIALVLGVVGIAMLPIVGKFFNLDFTKFSDVSDILDFGPERREQFAALLSNLKTNNFLGAGYGVNAIGSIRSDTPGMYELTYIAIIFATGIIGSCLIFGFYIASFYFSLRDVKYEKNKKVVVLPWIVGLFIIMCGAFTNPYLANFDYCWLILVPLAYANPNYKKRVKVRRIVKLQPKENACEEL